MATKGKKKVAQEEPGKTGKTVPVSSLDTLELFKYKGETFTKRRVTSPGIVGLSTKGDKKITLPPDTLVTPI